MRHVKNLLKAVFPIVFLKRSFLFFNKIKAASFDRLFFPEQVIPISAFRIHELKNPFLELDIDVRQFNSDVRGKLRLWTDPDWTQDQYFLEYKNRGYLEPSVGWCVTKQKTLVYASLGFSRAPHVHKPSFGQTYFVKERISAIDKIISLRDTGEENYFHFYNDVLAKLFLLEKEGVNLKDYTIVVSSSLHSKQYFQEFARSPFLSVLKWHVQQPGEWIDFAEAIFCKPYTHTREFLDRAVAMLNIGDSPTGMRRIFLDRGKTTLRYVQNMDQIRPILEEYGFEIIDSAGLSVKQQALLFRQCRYLVGIHGAGLTNMIYRQGMKLSVLEVANPMPYLPFHYLMLAKIYGFDYDVILGNPGQTGSGGFIVDTSEFRERMNKMIGEG